MRLGIGRRQRPCPFAWLSGNICYHVGHLGDIIIIVSSEDFVSRKDFSAMMGCALNKLSLGF